MNKHFNQQFESIFFCGESPLDNVERLHNHWKKIKNADDFLKGQMDAFKGKEMRPCGSEDYYRGFEAQTASKKNNKELGL